MPYAVLPGRSSTMNTPDDKIAAAELVEDLLARTAGVDEDNPDPQSAPTGEGWALELMNDLQPVLDAAVKESNEAVRSSDDLQKAQGARAAAKNELEESLLAFRRLVRDVYGSNSREFHSLRVRTSKGDEPGEPPKS